MTCTPDAAGSVAVRKCPHCGRKVRGCRQLRAELAQQAVRLAAAYVAATARKTDGSFARFHDLVRQADLEVERLEAELDGAHLVCRPNLVH